MSLVEKFFKERRGKIAERIEKGQIPIFPVEFQVMHVTRLDEDKGTGNVRFLVQFDPSTRGGKAHDAGASIIAGLKDSKDVSFSDSETGVSDVVFSCPPGKATELHDHLKALIPQRSAPAPGM